MGSNRREMIVWTVGLVAVVVVAVWVVPRVASYADIADALGNLTKWQLAGLVGLGLGTIAVTGWSAKVALPKLTWWQGTQSTTCANFLTALIPTGADLAVRYAMYKSWGFGSGKVAAAIAVTGLGRYVTLLSLPLIGMGTLVATGQAREGMGWRLFLGIVAFVLLAGVPWLLLRRVDLAHRFAHRLDRGVHRMARLFRRPAPEDLPDRVLRMHAIIVRQARQRGVIVTLGQLAVSFANSVVLFAALRFVGLGPDVLSWGETFYAFALGTIAAIVPITPGNIGVTELIIVGVLGHSGQHEAQILAAALLYRIFTWLLPVPVGAVNFFWWRYRSARRAETATSAGGR